MEDCKFVIIKTKNGGHFIDDKPYKAYFSTDIVQMGCETTYRSKIISVKDENGEPILLYPSDVIFLDREPPNNCGNTI